MQDGQAARTLQSVSANNPGLCFDCVYARRIKSEKGSIFLQCQLSFTDSEFQRYPRLPVLRCSGYEKQPGL